jgi:hypothetical protein
VQKFKALETTLRVMRKLGTGYVEQNVTAIVSSFPNL